MVFSPDGRLPYVNHLRADAFDVIDVASHKIIQRVAVPTGADGSSDEAISPDGKEIWLGMPNNGKTTTIVNAQTYHVETVLNSGPRTNHSNFVTVDGVDYAYQTVGDLNQTLVYRHLSAFQMLCDRNTDQNCEGRRLPGGTVTGRLPRSRNENEPYRLNLRLYAPTTRVGSTGTRRTIREALPPWRCIKPSSCSSMVSGCVPSRPNSRAGSSRSVPYRQGPTGGKGSGAPCLG